MYYKEKIRVSQILVEVAPSSKLRQESLGLQGQLQPLRLEQINPVENNGHCYRVVDGRRRLTDMLVTRQKSVDALVYEEGTLTPETYHLQALTLNSGRPNFMDEADHVSKLIVECGYTVEEVSVATNLSVATILKRLDLHNKLLPVFQAELRSGVIRVSAAYQLVKLPKAEQKLVYAEGVKGIKRITKLVRGIRDRKNRPEGIINNASPTLPSDDDTPGSVPDVQGPGLFLTFEEITELIQNRQGSVAYNGKRYFITITEAGNRTEVDNR